MLALLFLAFVVSFAWILQCPSRYQILLIFLEIEFVYRVTQFINYDQIKRPTFVGNNLTHRFCHSIREQVQLESIHYQGHSLLADYLHPLKCYCQPLGL
jgi:hypothetical protein